mgnify:CR=1 FL=1|jgi:hypothetical protein
MASKNERNFTHYQDGGKYIVHFVRPRHYERLYLTFYDEELDTTHHCYIDEREHREQLVNFKYGVNTLNQIFLSWCVADKIEEEWEMTIDVIRGSLVLVYEPLHLNEIVIEIDLFEGELPCDEDEEEENNRNI